MNYNGVELYEKDGKIGVLVSPGYGAGWSTWGCVELAYDKRVVEFWLSHKDDEEFMATVDNFGFGSVSESVAHKKAMEFFNSIGYGSPYMGGFYEIELAYVKKGVPWRITEYDGSESLVTFDTAGFITFAEDKEGYS